jgi:eukaryotic-like serine/threonine-protein kinase
VTPARLADHTVRRLQQVANRPDATGTRYTIQDELGRGGMGTVYLATDGALGRDVALKVANNPGHHPALEARMRREAAILARLEHPGIVPIHDVGTLADGRLFYAMKLVRGRTLTEHLHDTPAWSERLRVFERLLEPVGFAHSRGVVHRDLKPENVMVGSFGEVLVMDWGVAKLLGEQDPKGGPDRAAAHTSPGTDPGAVLGTPGFMAPEQAEGRSHDVDQRADVYALGAILCGVLAGDAALAHGGSPLDALARRRDVDKRLKAICAKAMRPRSGERYPDASSLAADLARFRAGEAVSAYPETVVDRVSRWVIRFRVPILLVLAYLLMRVLVALTVR